MCSEKNVADLTISRQKEQNDMCLAIEKMKEKGRREERMKSLKALEEEREKSSMALEEEREKSSMALEEEREKSSKALDEERKNGICNLIEGCRKLGETLEKTCQLLMMCYHLTQNEASAYLKEYYV